jgi:hypothetical protein
VQAALSDRIAELRRIAVASICQNNMTAYSSGQRGIQLCQRNLALSRCNYVSGHASAHSSRPVRHPRFRQEQPKTDHAAALLACKMKADRDLTVVDAPECAAVLSLNADRMLTLLGKASVIDYECLNARQLGIEVLSKAR